MKTRSASICLTSSVQIQTVVTNENPMQIMRTIMSLARTVELARQGMSTPNVEATVALPDHFSSESTDALHALLNSHVAPLRLRYERYPTPMSVRAVHHELAGSCAQEFLWMTEADATVSPRSLERMIATLQEGGGGAVEARPLPLERFPIEYDSVTGDTSWIPMHCAMMPTSLYREVGGFDATHLDEWHAAVDLSWRIRLFGSHVRMQPAATAFRDACTNSEVDNLSHAERYRAASSTLLLALKWSHSDVAERTMRAWLDEGDLWQRRAASDLSGRLNMGWLPPMYDPEHRIGRFDSASYAPLRYVQVHSSK
ncbi:glycosyltransferase family 2 protein [Burkholderia ubonensis]|uniref:glycosyltransferase family 2 protein n=1 Tax=Burkholderia ubonensis TaxID=101571 RepID=UPI000A67FA92|nr:hypothetical protein [Burkholderia ubonensis]